MPEAQQGRRKKWPFLLIFILILCLALLATAVVLHPKKDTEDYSFSVLILGDSQMAGVGWDGGYENCILETYPNSRVINLAQNGSLLANGDIHAQWELYLSEATAMPDFVLLDGGLNDLPYLRKEEFKDTGLTLVSEALRSLIERIHETSPDTHIIYTLMPPFAEWKDSDDGPPSYDIQRLYWKQLHNVANAYDYVTVLDLFTVNPFGFPSAANYRKFLAGSIHLSEAGYRETFGYIQTVLTTHLEVQDE